MKKMLKNKKQKLSQNFKKVFVYVAVSFMSFISMGSVVNAQGKSDVLLLSKTVSKVSKIDISKGMVTSDKAIYKLMLPDGILKHIYAERVVLKDKNTMQEKINFYCNSYSKKYKPVPVMSFYVFDRSQWLPEYALEKVVTTKDYVIAVQTFDDNPFTEAIDRNIFTYVKQNIGDAESVKKVLTISKNQIIPYDSTVFIDGVSIEKSVIIIDGTYYVPLKTTAEELGYVVKWEPPGIITITKDKFKDTIKITDGANLAKGGKLVLHENRAYVSIPYFMRGLGKSIEIDENKNVFIISK